MAGGSAPACRRAILALDWPFQRQSQEDSLSWNPWSLHGRFAGTGLGSRRLADTPLRPKRRTSAYHQCSKWWNRMSRDCSPDLQPGMKAGSVLGRLLK